MKEDLKGFFANLPPDARRLVEEMNQGKKRQEPARREQEESFSEFEAMVMGGGHAPEVQVEDRMFDEPEPAPKPRARKSMRDLIESIEKD